MPLPNVIEAYEDIRIVLDAVVRQGGGTYVLSTREEAITWRRRAYKFRQLANREGEKKYNALILRLRNGDSHRVRREPRNWHLVVTRWTSRRPR